MADKQLALELAAFLDSPEAEGLELPRRDVRELTEAVLSVCYDVLGTKPRLLSGEDVEALLREHLPGRVPPRDPRAEHLPALLTAYFDHLEATQVVTQRFEIRRALDEALPDFVAAVRSGAHADRQVRPKQAPFVHGAPKLGRNDPCSCGSGKKYKKCHGKNA